MKSIKGILVFIVVLSACRTPAKIEKSSIDSDKAKFEKTFDSEMKKSDKNEK